MMTKKKTSAARLIRFTWALPVVALLLFAFAEPQYKTVETGSESSTAIEKKEKGKKLTINGKVVDKKTGKPIPGASVVIKGSTVGCVSDKDGSFKLVDPNAKENKSGGLESKVVVSFVGLKTVVCGVAASGSATDKAKYTFEMEDAVQIIYNRSYSGEQLIPPPPPPPPAKEKVANNKNVPPPPPPPSKGEREIFFIVEDMPKYPGGYESLNEYIVKMQKKIAVAKKVKGKAKVSFTVAASGEVTDIKVVEKDNDGAAKGAFIIAKEMKDWKPGKQRGKAVPVKYLLPVEFK